jgi:hypothetical protein
MCNQSIMDNNNIGRVIAWSIFSLVSTLEGHETIIVRNYQTNNIYAYIEAMKTK